MGSCFSSVGESSAVKERHSTYNTELTRCYISDEVQIIHPMWQLMEGRVWPPKCFTLNRIPLFFSAVEPRCNILDLQLYRMLGCILGEAVNSCSIRTMHCFSASLG